MKFVIYFSFFICAVVARPEEKYVSKFKNVDLDEILKNERLLNSFYKCLMEGNSCTPEGEELNKLLPEAIQTGCKKCTDQQKADTKKIVTFLMKEKAQWLDNLVKKYDADEFYRTKYRDEIKAYGFDV